KPAARVRNRRKCRKNRQKEETKVRQDGLESDAETDIEDVAVPNHVVLGLLANQAMGLNFTLAAKPREVAAIHRLGADEAARQVRMNVPRGLEGGAPFAQHPGANLFF